MQNHITNNEANNRCVIAFLFDSGKVENIFYGGTVFEKIIEGKELVNNPYKMIFSCGDILDRNIYSDITPFVIHDEMCTVNSKESLKDYIYAIMVEDITEQIAKSIDKRLKKDFPAYIGMTSINIQSADSRKQFWKSLIRSYSVEYTTITVFGYQEEGFICADIAEKYEFYVVYDNLPEEWEGEDKKHLFSTRMSTFINSYKQLEKIESVNDSDRGLIEMNFALVKEVGIAGVQIWKAIEDINQAEISKQKGEYVITDYIFTSLYQAAQGVERLLKVIIELIVYGTKDKAMKEKSDSLLYSHNHIAMMEFIVKQKKVLFNANEIKLITVLYKFYSDARYSRFKFNKTDTLELALIQGFGKNIKEDNYDNALKHLYGKTLGKISQTLYTVIRDISTELKIYTYELNYMSAAYYVLTGCRGEDLYEVLKNIEQSKKELLWYIMKDGHKFQTTKLGNDIEPLDFDEADIASYLNSLITNNAGDSSLYDFVSEAYDELAEKDKSDWLKRVDTITALVGNNDVFFDDVEW